MPAILGVLISLASAGAAFYQAAESRLERIKAQQAVEQAEAALKKAEEERLARTKIEERLSDRTLTALQIEDIVAKVKPFAGQEYTVTTYWGLREPQDLANRIHQSLIQAGWKYIKHESAVMLPSGISGVQVYVHPGADERVKNAADSLISALIDENITVYLRKMDGPNNLDNKLHLNIGVKPQ